MPTPGTRPLRVLVAGAGLFGREHLDRLVIREDVEVAGIADPNPAALDLARTRYQVADLCTDPLEMIARIPADAVIVATPSATHVEIALGAIDHKMAVLLEKPVAPSAELALRLADAAEAADVLVLPGHVLRHDRNHRRLAEIIRSGGIGAPLYVNARRYRDDSHAARYSDVDPVLMTLIHDIDLALWVAGASFRAAQAWRKPVADFRSMTATSCVTTTGVICDLRTAWTFAAGDLPADRLEVVGDRGSVELEVGKALHHYAEGKCRAVDLVTPDDALANELDHFLDCLRDPRRQPALTLRDAAAGLQLAGGLLRSLESGRAEDVEA
jgi:predicted dehydrogenase